MKFREHRGSLEHSLSTVVEIGNTFTDVCKKAREVLAAISGPMEPGELMLPVPIILTPCIDTRIGWEGYFVSMTGWGVVGIIDGMPVDTPPDAFSTSSGHLAMKNEYIYDEHKLDTTTKHYLPTTGEAVAVEQVGLAAEENSVINDILDKNLTDMGTFTGADFFQSIKDLINEGRADEVGVLIDSLPADLQAMNEVRKGMVVLPDAEHMSEAMVDSTRGLHLYYMEAGSGVTCEQMRKHLSRYAPWAEKHYPQWFRDDTSHLTKAGRAILAHALTIGAHNDPDAREHYFKPESIRRQRVWDNPIHQRIRMTFKPMIMGEVFEDGGFIVHKRFLDASPIGDNRYVLQLNRSDMPKAHRGKFKTEAFKLVFELIEEGMAVQFVTWQVSSRLESSSYDVIPAMASRW